ncbi:MAG: thiamine pyrophosphate-dependent dehydrogenase E1 component subunit alpha [Myxococcales bacterium]|nr:thiamine pyrophosphate-dependent dehydrogenase E1 component subunit alpha [Myxococcales bacterium]
MHELMLTSRLLEERLIRMQRQGDGYFWIGGPGEEAFNVALGLLVKKGRGLDHDFLHLHYRSSPTLIAMGADPVDSLRLMANTASDPYTQGRNFAGHYSVRAWNVCPISSPIEVQYSIAIGTAMAQRRHGGDGITIVQGGDAGSAEGDFATCLVWSSRPGQELPILIIVANNSWGISTAAETQHGDDPIAGRGAAFGMRTMVIDGNDPIAAYLGLSEAMSYVRKERKPLVLEARLSRLHGHSSSSGANRVTDEPDCLADFEAQLDAWGLRDRETSEAMRAAEEKRLLEATREVLQEPKPAPEQAFDYVFATRNIVAED